MSAHEATPDEVGAASRWRAWQARGAQGDRRRELMMSRVAIAVAIGLGAWLWIQAS